MLTCMQTGKSHASYVQVTYKLKSDDKIERSYGRNLKTNGLSPNDTFQPVSFTPPTSFNTLKILLYKLRSPI